MLQGISSPQATDITYYVFAVIYSEVYIYFQELVFPVVLQIRLDSDAVGISFRDC